MNDIMYAIKPYALMIGGICSVGLGSLPVMVGGIILFGCGYLIFKMRRNARKV